MILSSFSLTIGFAQTAVSIQTTNPNITHILQTNFRHCQVINHSPKTIYTIDDTSKLEPLMQQLVEELITDNNNHTIIHGGAVAINGKGILLCGASGSGKSTLTTWLCRQGAEYLTDEIIAIPQEQKTMTGFPRPFVLKQGSSFVWEKWLSAEQASQVLTLPAGIRWLAPDVLGVTIHLTPIQPHLILFPTFDPAIEFAVRPLSSAQTTFQLLQQHVNARNLPRFGIDTIKTIATHADGFTITYNDVSKVEQWINEQTR